MANIKADFAAEQVKFDDLGDIGRKPHAVINVRRWSGVTPITYNIFGTLGFVIGSLLWCIDYGTVGTYIFAGSCILCGNACVLYVMRFVRNEDHARACALAQQAVGCYVFTISSFLFVKPESLTIALIGFLSASLLFLCGCTSTQAANHTWTGVLASPWPNTPGKFLATSLLNTVGSFLFTFGSVCLFYDWGQMIGAWCYEIGSIAFFCAAWGDMTFWWEMGLTQSEQQHADVVANQEILAAVKLV